MKLRVGPGFQSLRAGVLAAVTLMLAVAAHVAAGSSAPGLSTLLLIGMPVACASVVMARRLRRTVSIVGFLALGQMLLHAAFVASMAGHCTPQSSDASITAGHGHGHASAASCAPMDAHSTSLSMLVFHACATLAVAVLLAHGDRVILALWVWAQPRVAAPQRTAIPVLRHPAVIPAAQPRLAQWLVADPVSRRGPPRSRAFLVPA